MNTDISIFIAFSGGVLSFLSPCVLPLIPSYISLLLGDYAEQLNGEKNNKKNKKQIMIPALLFIAGFTTIFVLLGLSASYLGQILLKNLSLLRKISGVVVILLGLHLSGIIKLKFLYIERRINIPEHSNMYLRAVVMGLALALAWTPCVGPILSSILLYTGTSKTIIEGGIFLAFYSLGFAVPFLLTALFLDRFLSRFKKIKKYLPLIQTITGIFLIILGILIYTNHLNMLQ